MLLKAQNKHMTPQTNQATTQDIRQAQDTGFASMLSGRESPEIYNQRMYGQGVAKLHEISAQIASLKPDLTKLDDVDNYNALLRKYEHTERSEVMPYAREAGVDYTPSFNSSMYLPKPKSETVPPSDVSNQQNTASKSRDDSLKAFSTGRLINMRQKLDAELSRRGVVTTDSSSKTMGLAEAKNIISINKTKPVSWPSSASRLLGAGHWSESWNGGRGSDEALNRGVTDSMVGVEYDSKLKSNRHRIILGRLVIMGDKPGRVSSSKATKASEPRSDDKTLRTSRTVKTSKNIKTPRAISKALKATKDTKTIKATKSTKASRAAKAAHKTVDKITNKFHQESKQPGAHAILGASS